MIVKKFEEQVERFYGKPAVKTNARELTYGELNKFADGVALAIAAVDKRKTAGKKEQRVALLFEHGIDMIVAVLGVLKADDAYVPLDISYPEKRLLYLLENSESFLILTNNRNHALAQQLAGQTSGKCHVLNIETIDTEASRPSDQREVSEDRTAYILYTSGSTGKPKGVSQTLRNMWYYTRNWIDRFSISDSDRMSLFTSFTHDGAVQDIFSALLSGACLYPFSLKESGSSGIEDLYLLLVKEKISIWHSVPSLFRFFSNALTEKDLFYDLRWVLLGGEPLREHDLQLFRSYYPHARLANVYGQTESSVSTICSLGLDNTFDDVCLGEPLDETEILLVGEDGDIVETMGVGEIVVSSAYLTPGYWRNPESSERVFTRDEELGRLYWTGDLGRLTAEGTIKMMGRKDFQVKVRGFRVETGEIETALMRYRGVKEVVTIAKPDQQGDNYLSAYLVIDEPLEPEALRKYLSSELPEYMIPRHFLFLEKMPLNSTGKIDRQHLPEPEEAGVSESAYAAPTNKIEEKIAEIWQEVLGVEKIGINDNFIELGGHSLLVISIISKIHQEFDVELQLNDVFDNPTIKEMALLIKASPHSLFSSIEPVEDKEYYPVTADQKAMFVLNQLESIGVTYNIPGIIPLEEDIDRKRFEQALHALVRRHEAFRTSFRMMSEQLVQVIHREVEFQVSYIECGAKIKEIVKNFIRPFDLGKAPLFRAALVKLPEGRHLLLLDTHHIISDGQSQDILGREFACLYENEELPPFKLRYVDYAEWENRLLLSDRFKSTEEYWLNRFRGEIPDFNLPLSYSRPDVQEFTGDVVFFILGQEMMERLKQVAKETGATLFMILLAMFLVLLYKYTGLEDIVIGSIIAGRNHVDLEDIVGMFVKTLALRHHPAGNKTFETFLQEVKQNTLEAFENQDYPFSQLVQKLGLKKNRSRNPLFDVAFVLQSKNTLLEKRVLIKESKSASYGYEMKTAKFDLTFEVSERSDGISCAFQFCTALFRREDIELMKERFLSLVENVLNNPNAKLQHIDYAIPVEKEMIRTQKVEFDF